MANTVRTKEELTKAEYNYFIALKLSGKEKNTTTIEKAISKTCGSTSGDLISRRLIALRNDITEIMVNDATYDPQTDSYKPNSGGRAREAEAAKNIKLSELMSLIQNMCMSNGRIFKSTLNELCVAANKTAEYFTLDELMKSCEPLKAQGIKFIDNTTSLIPFGDFEKAGKLLETPPAKADLYDFLGISRTASVAEISTAKSNAYNEGQKKSDLRVKQSVSNICSMVDSILTKSPEVRKQYDYYIQVKESVWEQFKMRKTYGAKSISIDEYYDFAQTLQKTLSLGIDEVEQMLGSGLKYYNLVVAGGDENGDAKSKLGIPDLELCPYAGCGKIYRAGSKVCPHCSRPLEVICWNCSAQVPFTAKQKVCKVCGAVHDAKDRLAKIVSELDAALREPVFDPSKLQAGLVNLKNLVPSDKGGGKTLVSQKCAQYEQLINKKIKEEETTGENYRNDVKAIREQMALKNFMSASNMANNLRRKYPTYNQDSTNKLCEEIKGFLTKAQAGIEAVKRYAAAANEAMVIEYASKVLELCADYHEAQQFLQKYPPKAPVRPRISVSDDQKVLLEWDKNGDQKAVTYTVVKKIGTAPQNAKDGSVVEDNLQINFYEDANIVSATPYYYAVFAERCGVSSPILSFPTPVQVFGNVKNISQEILPGKISVRWDAPENFATIDVWKKKGTIAPLSEGDGLKLSGTKDGFIDEDCDSENSYLIIVTYNTQSGRRSSKGITHTFKKYNLIEPLKDVKITPGEQNEFTLTAKNPSDEKIRLVFSKNKLPCRTDTVLPMDDYNMNMKGGSALSVFYDNQNRTCFTIPENTVGFVYTVVYNDQLFSVSAPVAVNTVPGIRNLSYDERNDSVKITGVVNQAAKRIIAKISGTKFPKTMNDDGEEIAITKEKFEQDGGFIIKLKSNASHYITLFAELNVNGQTMFSSGISLGGVIDMREKVTIQYSMQYEVNPAKSFKMTVKFQADEPVTTPALIIMKGFPRPLNKSMGTLVERIGEIPLKKGLFSSKYTAKITIDIPPDRKNTKYIIFLADENVKHAKIKEVASL